MSSQRTPRRKFSTHLAVTKGRLNISDAGPRFGSTKLASAAIRHALGLAVLSALLIAARPALAQTTEIGLDSFFAGGPPDGSYPNSGLTSDGKGNFYGTNFGGGLVECAFAGPCGTVYELSPTGSGGWNETVIYNFCSAANCADGQGPYAPVVFDSAGNLYGTAAYGGANGYGVVFKLSPAGTSWEETVLYNFCSLSGCADGGYPASGLIFDPVGNLYGTAGAVFELSPSASGWTEKVIYGGVGGFAGLTMDAAGNIFGAADSTVFELSPNGSGGWTPTVIPIPGGGYLAGGTPVLDSAGNIYGTTQYGGAYSFGLVYKLSPGNDEQWTGAVLHSFGAGNDGSVPSGGVLLDAPGNVYGTTSEGGHHHFGSVFELGVKAGYEEKLLWSFNAWDGSSPLGSLISDSAGNLYGTTIEGGSTYGYGNDGGGFGVAYELRITTRFGTYTALASTLNPSTYGQQVTWTAKVTTLGSTPPTGEVNFKWDDGHSIGTATLDASGVATLSKSNLHVYTYPLTAVYLGHASNAGSTSTILNQMVNETTSAATLTSSPNPSTHGHAVTFTATISSATVEPTGPVTFTAGETVLGTRYLSGGNATFTTSTLAVGSITVTATYNGDSNIGKSSASLTQTVQQ